MEEKMPAVFVWRPARLERDGAWNLLVQTGSSEAFRQTTYIDSNNFFVSDLAAPQRRAQGSLREAIMY